MSLNSSSLDSWAGHASATRSRVSGTSPIQASSPSESADCKAWESWSWMGASVPSCGGSSVGSVVGELAGVAVNVAVGVSVGISVGAAASWLSDPGCSASTTVSRRQCRGPSSSSGWAWASSPDMPAGWQGLPERRWLPGRMVSARACPFFTRVPFHFTDSLFSCPTVGFEDASRSLLNKVPSPCRGHSCQWLCRLIWPASSWWLATRWRLSPCSGSECAGV